MATVYIPTPLRSYTHSSEVTAAGDTLMALVDDLDSQFPGFKFRVVDEQDQVRPHIKFFVGNEHNDDLHTAVEAGLAVHIIAALSGG